MQRASNTFSVLQATAAIVTIATILWSLGLPSFRFAEAANVTTYTDTLSTSEPNVVSNHTIVFTTPTGVANTETITIDFSDGFVMGSVDFTDIDVATSSGEFTLADDCSGSEMASATTSGGTTLTITMCAGDGGLIAANGTTTIEIGTHATFQTTGDAQITNPGTGSKQIPLTAGSMDTGETRVAIVDTVTVTATVDTEFTFSVGGVTSGQTVNGTTTGGATSPTLIPFGVLTSGSASTAAQDLTVATNASNGFTVTVVSDGQLDSATLADIDGFRNGNFDTTPVDWEAPSVSVGDEDTYGHWGLTSDDNDIYGSGQYVSASTSPVDVMTHSGPTLATTTRVGYTVQISALQEAAEDYQAVLTYIATPTF